MSATLYKFEIHIKKLIFLPVKVYACVRAAIFVSKKLTVFMHNKTIKRLTTKYKAEFLRSGVWYFITMTELFHSLLLGDG